MFAFFSFMSWPRFFEAVHYMAVWAVTTVADVPHTHEVNATAFVETVAMILYACFWLVGIFLFEARLANKAVQQHTYVLRVTAVLLACRGAFALCTGLLGAPDMRGADLRAMLLYTIAAGVCVPLEGLMSEGLTRYRHAFPLWSAPITVDADSQRVQMQRPWRWKREDE